MTRETYWDGRHCLEDGLPWLTPRAIAALDKTLQLGYRVLEFGAGGSTIFFAERCREVVSFESNQRWANLVQDELGSRGLTNVRLRVCGLEDALKDLYEGLWFDLLLVDSQPVPQRKQVLLSTLPFVRPGGVVVVDNYSLIRLGLDELSSILGPDNCNEFDDTHWQGSGTVLFRKPLR